jgi:uncharacterized protein (TIGR02646 family)
LLCNERRKRGAAMIYVDRAAVSEPVELKPYRDAGYLHAKDYFDRLEERRQERYFNPHWADGYRVPIPALAKLFHGKCAFCESKVELNERGILDHLRPKWATRGLRGEYAPEHYWWLAFVWSNLYLACPACNKQRGQRFPVHGRRVAGPDGDVATERPLLLDPCADRPQEHLRFHLSGEIEPVTLRGEATVSLIALNRSELVRRRRVLKSEIFDVTMGIDPARPLSSVMCARLSELVGAGAEFSAYAAEVVRQRLSKSHQRQLQGLQARVKVVPALTLQTARKTSSAKYLDEVRIRDFRGIKRLALKAPSSDQTNLDWLMLIGENSAGKSSVLQALALNLMSAGDRRRLRLRAADFIRRGATQARVDVLIRGVSTWRELTIRRTGFTCSSSEAGAPLMAYGATRLPPPKVQRHTSLPFENLFNPFAPLVDPARWIVSLHNAEFDYAARALKAVLAIKQTVRFKRVRRDVIVDVFGSEVPLAQLSDGYQSVIALAADLMQLIKRTFRGGVEVAEGIVLLDELGAHLHPRWKMRIAKALRATFPRLQFIVTTHDPLCLRGLRNGETVAIERTARGRVFVRTDLPPIEGMRVDQILQSEYFGLRSAMDPDVEADFDRMYRLKAKTPSKLTAAQKRTLAELEQRLAGIEVLGSTRSERLMLSEINRYLAKEQQEPNQQRRAHAWKQAQARIAVRLEKELGIAL